MLFATTVASQRPVTGEGAADTCAGDVTDRAEAMTSAAAISQLLTAISYPDVVGGFYHRDARRCQTCQTPSSASFWATDRLPALCDVCVPLVSVTGSSPTATPLSRTSRAGHVPLPVRSSPDRAARLCRACFRPRYGRASPYPDVCQRTQRDRASRATSSS